MTQTAETWVFVALAGALGTLLRYAIGGWLARVTGGVFPWETFTINVVGCLGIGAVAAVLDRGALWSPPFRMALMAGFFGGFTTFSSLALETLRLAQGGQLPAAAFYVAGTNAVGLAAVWAGYRTFL
jgi:fluoride exporter